MSPGWGNLRIGNRMRTWTQVMLACAALLGVFAARNVPPVFDAMPVHFALSADAHHDQRPRFDSDRADWSVPASSPFPTPIVVLSLHFMPAPAIRSAVPIRGDRYNRPPPVEQHTPYSTPPAIG